MPSCINLKERFGRQFKVQHEESYFAERPEFRAAEEVWLQIIPCQRGHIFPWGGDLLAASTNTPGPTARKLIALPGVQVRQDGDDGVTVAFPVSMFDAVAAIMRPKKRRHLSENAKARLVEAGGKTRFRRGTQTRPDERPCVPGHQADQEAVRRQEGPFSSQEAP